jgi:hypothetical protein
MGVRSPEEPFIMTQADDVRDHHAHCVPHLLKLRILAGNDAAAPLPSGIASEVGNATGVILAEAKAAESAALASVAGGGRGSRVARFLATRFARLSAAADDAVAAAQSGNLHALRRDLRRFDDLTSATWTVQLAVCAPPKRRSPPRTTSPLTRRTGVYAR